MDEKKNYSEKKKIEDKINVFTFINTLNNENSLIKGLFIKYIQTYKGDQQLTQAEWQKVYNDFLKQKFE